MKQMNQPSYFNIFLILGCQISHKLSKWNNWKRFKYYYKSFNIKLAVKNKKFTLQVLSSLPLCRRRALVTLESARIASWVCGKGLKLAFRSLLMVVMSFWWRVLSNFVLCHFCSPNNKKVSIIHQYESSNTPNSNFITIWATEMAQYKIWQCSSPETHFYHQQASKGKL